MSIIQRMVPLMRGRFLPLSPLRLLHQSAIMSAVRPSPRTRFGRKSATVTAQSHGPPSTLTDDVGFQGFEVSPPLTLLDSGWKSGALDIEPKKALELLQKYHSMTLDASSTSWEQGLCKEFNVKPPTLSMLGRILNRCPTMTQRALGARLMSSASALGDPGATFDLIESGMSNKSIGQSQNLGVPMKMLQHMAKEEDNREAMALLGRVLITEQKTAEGLAWISKATEFPENEPAMKFLSFLGASEALVHKGRILLEQNNQAGAMAAFRLAAFNLDDPSAFLHLSQLEELGSLEQEIYLLKAATAGIAEACHNLGDLELAKIHVAFGEIGLSGRPIKDFGMAREWFQVAAADGFGLSMLSLASICKAAGQHEIAIQWIEQAEKQPELVELARKLKATW